MTFLVPSDFGQCPCGGVYEQRLVEVLMKVRGQVRQIDHVPQGACTSCGSHVYKAVMLEEIEALMRGQAAPGLRVLL
jgi:YgiT-type zinc finger domain-containing protein